jgi:hypothetical protein
LDKRSKKGCSGLLPLNTKALQLKLEIRYPEAPVSEDTGQGEMFEP